MNAKTLMITALAAMLVPAVHAITSDEIAAALDVDPGVGTLSCGDTYPWTVDESVSRTGGSSLRSGAISHGQTCAPLSLEIDCEADSKISFWYKTSTEGGCDPLNFYVDGNCLMANGGEIGWSQFSGLLLSGHHTLTWTYSKDGSVIKGSDCVWIDDFKVSLLIPKTASVTVSGVRCVQRVPWNGKLDIDYTVTSDKADADIWVLPIGYDKDTGMTMAMRAIEGDGVAGAVKAGTHRMTWTVTDDYPGFHSTALTVKMTALVGASPYLVIDLSGGVDALSYPVSYLSAVPAGGWTDEYKTTKMVLRLIPPGRFMMGSPSDEPSRGRYEDRHAVILTKPFYLGVFECTQKQYQLVMGTSPSCYQGEARPVERVSYNDLRGSVNGAGWPSHDQVDAASFMGRLRSKVNMLFDLPTEAQWEYACRAGTDTGLNNGTQYSQSNLMAVARCSFNYNDGRGGYSSGTTKVGSYLENAWGLYDMHGNVCEFCRDYWHQNGLGKTAALDPRGSSSGCYSTNRAYHDCRVYRGGSSGDATSCRSAYRQSFVTDFGATSSAVGFRVYCSPVAQ